MKKQDDRYFYLGNYPDNELGRIEDKNKYDNEEYVCDINSTTDAHAAIIRQIAEKSKVLDIGCASGLTGENLKRLKKCHIDGIEYDDKAIEFARKKGCYDNLSCFSITDTNSKEYKEFFKNNSKKYDYVVLCDVLEHLDKPWEVLINVKELLNKKGKILISIPNIAHIDVIKGLINGEFNYASLGILDSTHVRFFTESSFYDMIDNIYKFYNINFNVKLKNRIVIEPYYVSKSDIYKLFDLKDNFNDYLTLQFIFELEVNESKKHNYQKVKYDREYFNYINQHLNDIREGKEKLEYYIENRKFKNRIRNLLRKIKRKVRGK